MDIGNAPRTDRQRRRQSADGLLFGSAAFVPLVTGAILAFLAGVLPFRRHTIAVAGGGGMS